MIDRQVKEQLDYNQLLLNHLDRISILSSQISGVQTMGQGNIHYRETDKRHAFIWSVALLGEFIPDKLKDELLIKERKKLREKYKIEKKDENGKNYVDYDFTYYFAKLNSSINLLARKGLLIQSRGIGKYIKKPKNKDRDEEVWE